MNPFSAQPVVRRGIAKYGGDQHREIQKRQIQGQVSALQICREGLLHRLDVYKRQALGRQSGGLCVLFHCLADGSLHLTGLDGF